MIIGLPKEIKDSESRVGLVPAGVHALVQDGHKVLVENHAGEGSGIEDREYVAAGAELVPSAEGLWDRGEMIVKVKEPIGPELKMMREGQILFTYLHLAPAPELTGVLLERKVTGVAYETIRLPNGSLPLLTPMSEVAGRMPVQVGAFYLQKPNGGRGELLGGVPGVPPANVVILGGGTVGTNAAKMAVGLGARVTIIDLDADRLRYLDDIFFGQIETLMSNPFNIEDSVSKADLLIGGVLIVGAEAPKLVTRPMISSMKKGAVVVDVAVDQGGCCETTQPTTHSHPTFLVDGVVHYCVANMPGAVPRTSTFALTNVTLPYARKLARLGFKDAVARDPALAQGVNTHRGHVACKPV
ncbi:MAG: ald, partial [Bacteroidetes bacterium]|nr:ald [Bacteroidota bacterium]